MTEPTPRDRGLTREEFVAAMALIAESVYDFHARFGIPMVGAGLSSGQALEELRTRLPYLMEEVGEHARALNNDDLGDALLELADVAFVVAGSVLNMGGLAAASCREVALKNDAKTAATHYLEESSGKVLRRPPSGDLRGAGR